MAFSSVLLIDDDEDDFCLTRTLLEEAAGGPVTLEWAPTYQRGLSLLLEGVHDAALIDYRLGKDNGVDLLRTARARGCTTPLIMLTTDSDGRVDHDAMDAGADDYLVKGQVNATLLERSLRYALEHRRVLDLLKDREEHLRAVLESSSDVIALLDPEGTVLYVSNLVEDQREGRDVVRQTLQRHGYKVLEAVDGDAAVALLQTGAGPIHLLLTDVVMPHMSGRELVDKITRHDPSIRVLYTSGYTDAAIVRHGVLDPGIAFLQKPFTPEQLLGRVRDVLSRPDPRREP